MKIFYIYTSWNFELDPSSFVRNWSYDNLPEKEKSKKWHNYKQKGMYEYDLYQGLLLLKCKDLLCPISLEPFGHDVPKKLQAGLHCT